MKDTKVSDIYLIPCWDGPLVIFNEVYVFLSHVFCHKVKFRQNVSYYNIVFIDSQAVWERGYTKLLLSFHMVWVIWIFFLIGSLKI